MAYLNGGRIVLDGLVLALDAGDKNSYPGSGTTWSDYSGNGNNGTLTNGPTFNSGNGGSIVFDGTDDYVNTLYSSVFNVNDFTILGFFKSSVDDNTHDTIIARNGNVYSSTNGWSISRLRNGLSPTNALRLMLWGDSSYLDLTGPSIINGVWQQFAFIVNKTSSIASVYVNGILQNSGTPPTGNYYPSSGNPDLKIGADKNNGDTWAGNISNIMFYTRALSSTEILQNYNATKTRFNLI